MDNSRIHKSIRSHASQGKENEIAQFYSVPYFDIGFEFKGSYIAQNVDSFVQKLILSCCYVKNRSLTPNVHKCIKICIIIGFLSSEWNSTILTLSAFNIIILKFFFSFKNYSNDNEMLKQKKNNPLGNGRCVESETTKTRNQSSSGDQMHTEIFVGWQQESERYHLTTTK